MCPAWLHVALLLLQAALTTAALLSAGRSAAPSHPLPLRSLKKGLQNLVLKTGEQLRQGRELYLCLLPQGQSQPLPIPSCCSPATHTHRDDPVSYVQDPVPMGCTSLCNP